ncbi:MAG: helix-turn-helix domain-containing protein [Pseudomonadota bacterium]
MKLLSEWTKGDLERLIKEKVPEDSRLEYKGDLAVSKGKQPGKDDWHIAQHTVGETARSDIAAEIIAFANSNGGMIILGMEKSLDKSSPNTPCKIAALPECAKLADILRLGCRDLIEPRLERLDFIGLPTESDRSGAVLIQVGTSRLRPHRHTKTKECYFRRGESSTSMTMDEIKNLTLFAVTQEQREAERYSRRFKGLTHVLGNFPLRTACVFSVILTPLDDIIIPNVTTDRRLQQFPLKFQGEQVWDDNQRTGFSANFVHAESASWRPILRGIQAAEVNEEYASARQIFEDGSVCLALGIERPPNEQSEMNATWTTGVLANALLTMELARLITNGRDVPYSLRCTLAIQNGDAIFTDFQRQYSRFVGKLGQGIIEYLPMMITDVSSFDSVINDIDRDTWNYGGKIQARRLSIDWTGPFKHIESVAQGGQR